MNIVSIILCGLALLAAVMNTALFFREKKRTNTRFSALNNLLESVERETNGYILECIGELDKIQGRVGRLSDFIHDIDDRTDLISKANVELEEKLSKQIDELRQAVSDLKLDYKEAQEAANSVNDYASSLMNIFNYDPVEAEKKARNGGKAE